MRGVRERAERIRTDLDDRLAPDGWSITLHEVDGAFHIEFDHELSMPFAFGFGKDPEIDERRMTELLARAEFEVIRARPASVEHGPFLKNIRTMAGSMKWDPNVVAVVARSLGVHGLLPEAEADWLERA